MSENKLRRKSSYKFLSRRLLARMGQRRDPEPTGTSSAAGRPAAAATPATSGAAATRATGGRATCRRRRSWNQTWTGRFHLLFHSGKAIDEL